MVLDGLLRSQFGKPSGLIGSLFLGPLMNVANMRLIDAAIDALGPRTRDVLLDIGFGGGFSLFRLAEKATRGKVFGVDYSPDVVVDASERIRLKRLDSRIRVECANVAKLPFPAGMFDRILTVNSIYYWPHIVASLRETARVLKPGGRISVGFRSRACLAPYTEGWEKFALYEPAEFARMMRRAGFKVLRAEQRDEWPLLDQVLIVGERPAERPEAF